MKSLIFTICFCIDCCVLWSAFSRGGENESLAFWPMLAAAFTFGVGVWDSFQQREAAQEQADLLDQESKMNAELAAREAEEDARAESDEVRRARDQQRRRRAAIESAYAKSGVLLEGTSADILSRQREVDELNIQKTHRAGNERRKLLLWDADIREKTGRYQAKSLRRKANAQFISGVTGNAAKSYGNYKTWSA